MSNKGYPHDPKLTPGTWQGGTKIDGSRTALFSCPLCGGTGSLADHEIADNGNVTPSVVCMVGDCEFHEYITLENWQPNVI